MTLTSSLYSVFYCVVFLLALYAGYTLGFTGDSHTPPAPFIIELFVLPTGCLLLTLDIIWNKPITLKKVLVHVIGLTANAAIVVVVLGQHRG